MPQPLQKLWARQMHQAYLLLRWGLLQLLHLAIALEARTLRWKGGEPTVPLVLIRRGPVVLT